MTVGGEYESRSPTSIVRLRRLGIPPSIGYVAQRLNEDSRTSIFIWLIIVFVLIVQQDAFIDMPALSSSSAGGVRADINMFNTIAIVISVATIGIPVCLSVREIAYLASKNALSVLYVALVLISAVWSIHPDLTIRRGFGYVLSLVIAAYLTVRFNNPKRMKLISASFAVSAIGSLLYVIAYPNDGIMQIGELAGNWRGVFPHKNVLGPVMAVGVFVELYVLVASRECSRWRLVLLGLYLALVALSRSATALLMSAAYLAATCIYLQWCRDRLVAIVTTVIVALVSLLVTLVLWLDPEFALGLLGKDTTLTGRTELWNAVIALIRDRPLLGYGYRAMWSQSDPYWVLLNELVGGWGVTGSHNAFLEVTLELGAVGMGSITAILVTAFWRSIRCCLIGVVPLGWFSFVLFATGVFAAQTMDVFGLNQDIFWLIFTLMFFSCGQSLWARRRRRRPLAVQPNLANNNPLQGHVH